VHPVRRVPERLAFGGTEHDEGGGGYFSGLLAGVEGGEGLLGQRVALVALDVAEGGLRATTLVHQII
jgi:hypothetical protein